MTTTMDTVENTTQFFEKIREVLSANSNSIQLKVGQNLDLEIAKRLMNRIGNDGNHFYNLKNQQVIENISREVFNEARDLGMLQTLSKGKFSFQHTLKLGTPQLEKAKQLTEKTLNEYFDRQGYVFNGYRHTDETRRIILGLLISSNIIVEKGDQGEFQFRQIKSLPENPDARYLSKPFDAKKIIDQVVSPYLDRDATELRQLEQLATLREKAERLSGGNEKKEKRIFEMLQGMNKINVQEKFSSVSDAYKVKGEFENLELWKMGYPDRSLLILAEQRTISGNAEERLEWLNTPAIKAIDPQTEARMKDYDSKVFISY